MLRTIDNVEFLKTPASDKEHPRNAYLFPLEKKLYDFGFDFFAYRELFERYVCESLISTGGALETGKIEKLVELKNLPIGPSQSHDDVFRYVLGENLHGNTRYSQLASLFNVYESTAQPLFYRKKMYLESDYFKPLLRSATKTNGPLTKFHSLPRRKYFEKIARDRILMLENFREAGAALVPFSKSRRPSSDFWFYDIPWAIDYLGYAKLRDGAHRRATLFYLGKRTIPTLVVNFAFIDLKVVKAVTDKHPIVEGFTKFQRIVGQIAQI